MRDRGGAGLHPAQPFEQAAPPRRVIAEHRRNFLILAFEARGVAGAAQRGAGEELSGIAGSPGTLEAGKIDGIIAMPGGPTADIRATGRVSFVMKEGRAVKRQADRQAALAYGCRLAMTYSPGASGTPSTSSLPSHVRASPPRRWTV
jgi:hypothetical protein